MLGARMIKAVRQRVVDMVFASLFLVDIGIALSLFSLVYTVSPANQIYAGSALILFWIRLAIHFLLGVLMVAFFLGGRDALRWAVLLYVLFVAVVEKLWIVEPNAPEYVAMVQEIRRGLAEGTILLETNGPTVLTYPFWPVYVFYGCALTYVFFLRSRLGRREEIV